MSGNRRGVGHRGFVLLATLLLLVLAAVALVALGRMSMAQALHAAEMRSDLQQEWATRSCVQTLLPQSEQLLRKLEEQQIEPITGVRMTVELADHTYELIFADEQAKANINMVYRRKGGEQTDQVTRELLAASGSMLQIELRPISNEAVEQRGLPYFGSFEQITPHAGPEQLLNRRILEAGPVSYLTLWGDGKLNFRRATSHTLEAATSPTLNKRDVQQLVALRSELPGAGLNRVLELMDLRNDQKSVLKDVLTDESACHSLWIITLEDAGTHRVSDGYISSSESAPASYQLAVLQQSNKEATQMAGSNDEEETPNRVARPRLQMMKW